jgi:hypothetical protein
MGTGSAIMMVLLVPKLELGNEYKAHEKSWAFYRTATKLSA